MLKDKFSMQLQLVQKKQEICQVKRSRVPLQALSLGIVRDCMDCSLHHKMFYSNKLTKLDSKTKQEKKKKNQFSESTFTIYSKVPPPHGPTFSPLPKDRREGLVSRPKGATQNIHVGKKKIFKSPSKDRREGLRILPKTSVRVGGGTLL